MDFLSLTDASRLQFAMTAMFHWIFVPLTLGLGFIIAFMETLYVKTGDEFWKRATKYWMKLFAVNFAIGVATGIILEFEFGTNWSNYSWFVGDIFGAPLAIEGIFAFFMESTFFAIMYFGWDKVSKKAHLASTWLTAFGTNLSAVWILIANAWMQYPVGMKFNLDTARNEMVDFWAIVSSPVAINKIIHTVANGYTLASVVVIGVCGWYLLKKRNFDFSIKSMKVASIFGLLSLLVVIATGDKSAYQIAQIQPMKLAAMEGLYDGTKSAPLVAIGILNPDKNIHNEEPPYLFEISIPHALSYLAEHDLNAFVPGINDLLKDFPERQAKGKLAIKSLHAYTEAKNAGDTANAAIHKTTLEENFKYFGYGYLEKPEDAVPNVPIVFYAFRIMVILGSFFIVFFLINLWLTKKQQYPQWWLILTILSIPLIYICSQSGWIVAEVGRQPWTIQDLLPVNAAISGNEVSNVITTILIFFSLFTVLLIAELKIMFKIIKQGPETIE
ncbi:MAG: cytochrome ubiquinol oxidase subunit I [Parabacteroides sp.]|nr:cytochrome ubiquinol oxidase subunit I [Parabacteroides sp.]